MIHFKTKKIREEWESGKLDQTLQIILLTTASVMVNHFNTVMVLTSLFRDGDVGVHGLWRGADVRIHNIGFKGAIELTILINSWFEYNITRPDLEVAVFGDSEHQNHIHFQSHPNTMLRKSHV